MDQANTDQAALEAAQAALSGEHAAVYGYGVAGGHLEGARAAQAQEAYQAHRSRRDALERTVRELGGRPMAAAAGYRLPFPVTDADSAVRLAAELENRLAGVYADLVRAASGALRGEAAAALREAAVRSVRWQGDGVAFPGLAERAASAAPSSPAARS
ncbi:ferritin-like domain-containing protein [Streptomyces orinoci]|uniref:Ferritin-like domain-containing protein n=1 Tax=Streptomyces orinoci TaxID=67339 RepID=A0ABV3K7I3_STRON|nr:ferritin-like domain-containing protein [Streptomyces orinoci]